MSAQTTIAKLREHNEELLESLGKAYGDISEAVRQRGELAEQNAALLAEVERLQRERSEWRDRADALMTEQMTQMRDLTAEVEALRARLTLTPEKVERAVGAWWSTGWARTVAESNPQMKADIRRWLRAALLAAGMTDAALDAAEGGGR